MIYESVLATSQKGWRVLQRTDGTLQLDLGAVSMLLEHHQFYALDRLVKLAIESIPQVGTGKLAGFGQNRSVYICTQHNAISLLFDRMVLRFQTPDFFRLAQLCHRVEQQLPQHSREEYIDYLKMPALPSRSKN